jgi:nucleotide-binding universal stress UspA family protein
MLQTILVPLDGSELAERALPLAVGMVQGGSGKLVLTRVAHSHSFPGVDPVEGQVRSINEAEDYLGIVAARLRADGVAVETAVAYGPAADGILDEIRVRRPDLVVMATHGRSGLGRWVSGSVAEAVLGRGEVPVLLTRAWHAEQPARPVTDYQRLLVPLDGSRFAEAAVPVAAELAARIGAELVLMAAVFPPSAVRDGRTGQLVRTVDQDLEDLQTDARRYLAGIERGVRERLPTVSVRFDIRIGAPVDAIVVASEENGPTIVVMATHGRTGLSRLFLGSVAAAVLREGEVPLLLVRPRELAPIAAEPPAVPAPAEPPRPVELILSTDDLALIREALGTLNLIVDRKEHVHPRIHGLMARLEEATEHGKAADPVGAAT